jgi:hypothetical protein
MLRSLAILVTSTVVTRAPRADAAPWGRPWGVGVSIADPAGATVKRWLGDTAAVQATAGWRVLGNEKLELPGPLVAVDALLHWPAAEAEERGFSFSLHAGAGAGAGAVRAGCWFDSVAEFCADDAAFSALLRAPVGIDLRIEGARLEVGFEAVPAYRLAPAPHGTFLGGFFVRLYV